MKRRLSRIVPPPRFLPVAALLWSAFCLPASATGARADTPPLPAIGNASWIWGNLQNDVCELRRVLTLDRSPAAARILITADNGYELYVNGRLVGFDIGPNKDVWGSLELWDVTAHLVQGANTIGIRGICLGGQRGVIAALRVEPAGGGAPLELVTDAAWRVAPAGDPAAYSQPAYRETEAWSAAAALGGMGMDPWGALAYAGSKGGRREGTLPAALAVTAPDERFVWPAAVAFVSDDCSVYVPLRHSETWGIAFRVDEWTRAYTQLDLPCPSKIGRKLCLLAPAGPDAVPRVLLDAGQGVLGSPGVSYDGRSILLSYAPEGTRFFHIYRVPVAGGPPQQLTDGPFHDLDPAELPDGRIIFASTRIGTFEEYHAAPSRALFVMQANGRGIKSITHTPIFDNEPRVTADGRVAFIRSDNFFGRAKVETQIHAVRPDGSDGLTIIGAEVGAEYGKRLRAYGYGSPAPLPDGRIAVISTRGNFIARPNAAEFTFHRLPGALGDLAALPDGRLLATVLASAAADRRSRILAVLDPADNRLVKIHEAPGPIHSPVFVGPRPRPPRVPDLPPDPREGRPGATGFLYAQDVRITRKTHADWPQIRALRVLLSRAVTTRSSNFDFVHQGKQVVELGTVPIAPDGSFAVEVPADMPVALQAVDAEGRSELNEMSWIYVRPGERRACIGCHDDRRAAPPMNTRPPEAQRTRPLKLPDYPEGEPHRFRGNNPGTSGMMDLQFERFREVASLNRYRDSAGPLAPGRDEVTAWTRDLAAADETRRFSAANRLALFRDRAAAPTLVPVLRDASPRVRVAAAFALSACGTRDSLPPLLDALADPHPSVAQAAAIALENLTAHDEPVALPATPAARDAQASAWRAWLAAHPWPELEAALIARLDDADRTARRKAVVALGHIGGGAARAALRALVAREKGTNPYPRFVGDNRTDNFTFNAASPLNPRTLQAAVRALGHLGDAAAVPLLGEILALHRTPENSNLFLAEAAAEALGWIGTPEAEAVLIDAFSRLGPYVNYVGWYSDHPALYACHASPVHARILEALDRIGSTRAGPIVPHLIRSVPTDPDRALFLETDTYELLVGRVIRRSGRGEELIATCLAVLGDPDAKASDDLKEALGAAHNAWAGRPAADNRAAHLLSAVCRDARHEPAVRAAYERHRARPEDAVKRPLGVPVFQVWMPQRHWVLFYLGRTLGHLGQPASVDTLAASLAPELNEARHGRPDPAEPHILFVQLDYTPCWRAAAAWALGRIRDPRAAPVLLEVVGNLDNATDTRHAAAEALDHLDDPASRAAIQELAEEYPEISTRRALLHACEP